MEPTVALLIWIVIAVLLVPVIGSCIFIVSTNRSVSSLVNWTSLTKRIQRHCQFLLSNLRLGFSARYAKLLQKRVECEKRLTESLLKEKQLRELVDLSKTQIDNVNRQVKSSKAGKQRTRQTLKSLRVELAQIEGRLKLQSDETGNLQEALRSVEIELEKAKSFCGVLTTDSKDDDLLNISIDSADIAINRSRKQMDRCEKAIYAREIELVEHFSTRQSNHLSDSRGRIRQIENIVAKRESEAARPPRLQLNARRALLDRISKCSVYVSKKILSIEAAVSDVLRAIDPSIERAFRRLQLQVEQVRLSSELSTQAELDLEESISAESTKAVNLNMFIESNEFSDAAKFDAKARLPLVEESLGVLTSNLHDLKRRNLLNQQSLFYFDVIVRRLGILRLLIAAIPRSQRPMRNQFVELSNMFCAYLKSASMHQDSYIPGNFVSRLRTLEQNTLMVYIDIAKGGKEVVEGKELERLKQDVETISVALDLERAESAHNVERWTAIAAEAEAQNQQILLAVAGERKERNLEILKHTTQTLDVLSATISIAQDRASKAKAS